MRAAMRAASGHSVPDEEATPPTTSTAGQRVVEEFIALQIAAADEGQRLIQICVVDHSNRPHGLGGRGHSHLQCHFRGGGTSPWQQLDDVTSADVRGALRGHSGVRVHLHADAPENPPATDTFVKAIPQVTLTLTASKMLSLGEGDSNVCNICLEEYAAGDMLVCMPCRGLHKYHAACMAKWLEGASTCPCCQWTVPKSPSAVQLSTLMEPARAECERLATARPPPCQLAEDDEDGGLATSRSSRGENSSAISTTPPLPPDVSHQASRHRTDVGAQPAGQLPAPNPERPTGERRPRRFGSFFGRPARFDSRTRLPPIAMRRA